MSKKYDEIVKWGVIKPFFDKSYKFNSIDLETIDNELFLFGYVENDIYKSTLGNFLDTLSKLLINSVQNKRDILTWTRYDNTHILKLLLSTVDEKEINNILLKVGKVSPLFSYQYQGFTIVIDNIIKNSLVFTLIDLNGQRSRCVIYDLANLYDTDFLTKAKNYDLTYYSKIGIEYHIIDKERFNSDKRYRETVFLSNELDNRVLIDIAGSMLKNFKIISGEYPKTIYTNGSLARSYLLSQKGVIGSASDLQFISIFKKKNILRNKLLDYSMQSYHGGKIESYVLGYIKNAKIIDITSAYPYAVSLLPKLTDRVIKDNNLKRLNYFFYAFIRCDIHISKKDFIHPLVVKSPINKSNLSPYGYIDNIVITKIEYDYLLKNGVEVIVHDYIAIEHLPVYPYKEIVMKLFNNRLITAKTNLSVSNMYKTILNSLYGITYELTDVYNGVDNDVIWEGYRAGDFFNPVMASYITAITRTNLSNVSNHILENGGNVYLNMTDSIIYSGGVSIDIFSDQGVKVLGKYEPPQLIKNIIILGAGRYEYQDVLSKKYTIKNRGFSVKVKDEAFYKNIKLNDKIQVEHKTFVTPFKATTKIFNPKQLGYLIDDVYNINPFNLGGKRYIDNYNVKLNSEYTTTSPVYLEKSINTYL